MSNDYRIRPLSHLFREPRRQTPYQADAKPKGTPLCPTCHSVNVRGDWISAKEFENLEDEIKPRGELECPACHMAKDHFANGVVAIPIKSLDERRENILKTIRNSERIERSRNDQSRILWMDEERGQLKIHVSMPELARHLGRQLEKTFKGSAHYFYSKEEPFIYVKWSDEKSESSRGRRSKAFRSRSRIGRAA